MISEIRPMPAGAALQLALQPPAGATAWRLLRNGVDAFAGPDDAAALMAYEGCDDVVVDAMPGLINGAPIFYKPYYWISGAWVPAASASGTPLAFYADATTDVLALVVSRLAEGLKEEVRRGVFVFEDGRGIAVYSAPPLVDQTEPPVVTVCLERESPGPRGLGELVDVDAQLLDGSWVEHEGWLADVELEITGWCLNPEQRSNLRESLRRIVVANLPIFDAAGMTEIQFSQRHADMLDGPFEYPMFQVVCSFSCQAPVIVNTPRQAISHAVVTASGEFPPLNS